MYKYDISCSCKKWCTSNVWHIYSMYINFFRIRERSVVLSMCVVHLFYSLFLWLWKLWCTFVLHRSVIVPSSKHFLLFLCFNRVILCNLVVYFNASHVSCVWFFDVLCFGRCDNTFLWLERLFNWIKKLCQIISVLLVVNLYLL